MFQDEDVVFTVTKIFGVDAVKTRVFKKEEDAIADIKENIRMCSEDETKVLIRTQDNETYYILNKSENNPSEYIEFVLRRCIIK